jgi:hypothetical protein
MDATDFVDLLGTEWGRRWVLVRGVVAVVLVLAMPATVSEGIEWYARHRAAEITHRLQLPSPAVGRF